MIDGPATCIYVPTNKNFSITAVGEVQIAVAKSPSDKDFEPAIINPEDVIIKNLGKPGWEREAHFILDERVKSNMIYIGEAFVKGGQWASYPPHKHDDDNMPTEAETEEMKIDFNLQGAENVPSFIERYVYYFNNESL